MSVTIDELNMETQAPATPQGAASGGAAKQQPQPDIQAAIRTETERLHERELRLRAD